MSYFSRLTDIVTCNLTKILAEESDPQAAIEQLIYEMEEGLAGAKRSVATATASFERLNGELDEHRTQSSHWGDQAKQELTAGNEEQARLALVRKHEVDDLIAGLEQQLSAANATREHLTTTQRALNARLSEARRKQHQLSAELADGTSHDQPASIDPTSGSTDATRTQQIDSELEALKRELGQA